MLGKGNNTMAIRCHPETHYDAMGNAASERRTCVQPQSGRTVTLLTRRGYDSWGRADSVVYPDGETVRYRYGRDGRLRSMEGTKAGSGTARYIVRAGHDADGRRTLANTRSPASKYRFTRLKPRA